MSGESSENKDIVTFKTARKESDSSVGGELPKTEVIVVIERNHLLGVELTVPIYKRMRAPGYTALEFSGANETVCITGGEIRS